MTFDIQKVKDQQECDIIRLFKFFLLFILSLLVLLFLPQGIVVAVLKFSISPVFFSKNSL